MHSSSFQEIFVDYWMVIYIIARTFQNKFSTLTPACPPNYFWFANKSPQAIRMTLVSHRETGGFWFTVNLIFVRSKSRSAFRKFLDLISVVFRRLYNSINDSWLSRAFYVSSLTVCSDLDLISSAVSGTHGFCSRIFFFFVVYY